MDKSMILDLAFDGTCYRDGIKIVENEEYKKRNEEYYNIIENLCKHLPEEEKKKIDWDLFLALGGIESIIEEVFFKEGFKLGLIIGAQNFLG